MDIGTFDKPETFSLVHHKASSSLYLARIELMYPNFICFIFLYFFFSSATFRHLV